MTVVIETVDRARASDLISSSSEVKLNETEMKTFGFFLQNSLVIWCGSRDGQPVNMWGIIPPTLLSDEAYLWHYLLASAGDHTFVLARYSRLALERVMERYPKLVGHCRQGDEDAQRWVRWLGGKFGFPGDGLIPFTIQPKAAA
jgi:hypothetical protein